MIKKLNVDQQGQSLTEYAIALVLVAVIAIGALALLGSAVGDVFGRTVNFFSGDEENPGQIIVSAVDASGTGISNVRIYAFLESGRYTGRYGNTNAQGELVFDEMDDGNYIFRANYQASRFWSDTLEWPTEWRATVETGRRPLTVNVLNAAGTGINNVRVHAFTPAGRYVGAYGNTDENGTVTIGLVDGDYRFRANYRRNKYWSADINSPTTTEADVYTGERPFTVSVLNQNGVGLNNVRVYAFSTTDRYIGVYGNTNSDGTITVALPDGDYKFRVDYRGHRYWSAETNTPAASTVSVATDEISVAVSVNTAAGTGINNVRVYAFTAAGSYVGVYGNTDNSGVIQLDLPAGEFQFRADYRGNRYWSDTITTPAADSTSVTTGDRDLTISVLDSSAAGISNVRVYAFSAAGGFIGVYGNTDSSGNVTMEIPDGDFQFRADYRGHQYWSATISSPSASATTIQTGEAASLVTVVDNDGATVRGARVYVFTAGGAYTGLYANTRSDGEVTFELPVGQFNLRVNYRSQEYWSGNFTAPTNITVTVGDD